MRSAEGSRDAGNLTTLVPSGPLDTAIPRFERFTVNGRRQRPLFPVGKKRLPTILSNVGTTFCPRDIARSSVLTTPIPYDASLREHTGGHWNSVLALAVTSNLNRSTVKSTTVSSCVK
jgi:hypothetical protein